MSEVPVLLTVEEAGELLRIGRTKAYALTREWRETNGASGLPVIDLGNVLRVPRRALEELIGTDLIDAGFRENGGSNPTLKVSKARRHRKSTEAPSQPDLFSSQVNT